MENLQFDEELQYARPAFNSDNRSWLANLVIKSHLAKDNAGEQKVLVVVLGLAVFATGIVLWSNGAPSASPPSLSSQLIIKSEIPDSVKSEIPPDVFNSLPAEFYPKDLSQSTLEQLPSALRQQLGV